MFLLKKNKRKADFGAERAGSRKQTKTEKFYEALAQFRANPMADMGERLVELLPVHELKDRELEIALADIDKLVTDLKVIENDLSVESSLDEGSERLFELVQSSIKDHRNSWPLIRRWVSAICKGDECEKRACEQLIRNLLTLPLEQTLSIDDVANFAQDRGGRFFKATQEQFDSLSQAFNKDVRGYELADAFECYLRTEDRNTQFSSGVPTRLLCHCSKNSRSLQSIFTEGLQLKGVGGRLGRAIYLSDSIEKCMSYCQQSEWRSERYGVVLVVETALGNIFETNTELYALPESYNSVKAVSHRYAEAMNEIRFADSTSSFINVGGVLQEKTGTSNFHHNEFAIYDPLRVRLRFILVFRCCTPQKKKVARTFKETDTVEEVTTEMLFRAHQQWLTHLSILSARLTTLQKIYGANSLEAATVKATLEAFREEKIAKALVNIFCDIYSESRTSRRLSLVRKSSDD